MRANCCGNWLFSDKIEVFEKSLKRFETILGYSPRFKPWAIFGGDLKWF